MSRAPLAVTASARCCLHEGIYSDRLIQQLAESFLEIGRPEDVLVVFSMLISFTSCHAWKTPGRLPHL